MRVIGGTCRGRPIKAPSSFRTRPTSDRVREAMFDILGSIVELVGASALDLFAGSGALGIEALSRGAERAVFVDRSPKAVATVRANLHALGLRGRARVVRGEALSWISTAQTFDIAFCDPPYDFRQWNTLLGGLRSDVAVLESGHEFELPSGWVNIRTRRYGDTLVTVVRSDQERLADKKGRP